jgi:hypothetical protein
MSSGYSRAPLTQKLGIKKGYSLAFFNAPSGYSSLLGDLPGGATIARGQSSDLDFVQLFATRQAWKESSPC